MKLIKYDIDSSLYHHSEHDYHCSSYRRISTCKSHPWASMQPITPSKEIGDPSRRLSLPRHANLPWTGSFSARCGCTPPTIAPSLDRSTLEKTILPVVGRAVVISINKAEKGQDMRQYLTRTRHGFHYRRGELSENGGILGTPDGSNSASSRQNSTPRKWG